MGRATIGPGEEAELMSSTRQWSTLGVAVAALALAGGVAACGSSDGGSNTATTAAVSSGGDDAAKLDASAVLARDYKGVIEPAPSSGPAAAPGKTIWFSNCVAFEGCARFGGGLLKAAKVLGWKVKVVDNKNDPRTSIAIIRQAVAAKADGVIDTLSDCPNIKSGLQVAKAAKIPVVTYAGLDCDNPALGKGGESLYPGHVRLGKAADSLDYYRNQGAADAEFILALAQKKGIASPTIVTALPQGQLFQNARQQGLEDKVRELCADCKVKRIRFTVQQAVAKGQQIIKSGILQNPGAQVFYYGNDAFLPLGIQAALQANKGKFKIICCGDGGKLSTANVRAGDLAETVAGNFAPLEMWAWDTMDVMNRLLAGQAGDEIPAEPNVTYYFDKEHNLPASGPVAVPYDYVKAFTSVWKGSAR
jgi:ribose transport system substrate-binding protein